MFTSIRLETMFHHHPKVLTLSLPSPPLQVLLPVHQGLHPEPTGRRGGVLPQRRALPPGRFPQQPPLGLHAGRGVYYPGHGGPGGSGGRARGWRRFCFWFCWGRHGEERAGDMIAVCVDYDHRFGYTHLIHALVLNRVNPSTHNAFTFGVQGKWSRFYFGDLFYLFINVGFCELHCQNMILCLRFKIEEL